MRRRVGEAAVEAGPAAGIYRSLLLGDRSGIPWDCMRAFRRTGTSHLLAISGLNLVAAVTLGALLAFPGAALLSRRCRPLASLALRIALGWPRLHLPRAVRSLFLGLPRPGVGGPGGPCPSPVQAERAPGRGGRLPRHAGCPLLAPAARPLADALSPRLRGRGPQRSREDGLIRGAVRVTLGACLYTAPVTVWVFGTVPTLALFFNIAAGCRSRLS